MSARTRRSASRVGALGLLLAVGLTTAACQPDTTTGTTAAQPSTTVSTPASASASSSPAVSAAPVKTSASPSVPASPSAAAHHTSTHFSAGGVYVTLTVSSWDGSQGVLTVTFKPQRPTYHLYSVDLPATGIDGLGRPTALTVQGAVRSTSKLITSAPVHKLNLPGVSKPLPVYPDGPVTFTIALRVGTPGKATAFVSYAACSEQYGCNIPVSGHRVGMSLKGGQITFTSS